MAETVIFEQTQLADFNYDDVFGIMTSYRFVDSALEIGKSYIVIWDGVEYPCVGQDMSAVEAGAVGLGDLSALGGEGNGEPFLIGYVDGGMLFGCLDNATHTVGIYLAEETTATNDVVIQNYSQTEVLYESVPKIWLKSPQSTEDNTVLVPFSYGEAIENVPISLDFSAGDQRVTVDDGYLAKSAVIEKPVDLVAENIRRGKVIANIEGDFIGDTEEKNIDGDNDLTFADGDFVVNPSSEEKVISKVTISKPSMLAPENIAKGVTIAGVEGTHEGGGGGGDILSSLIDRSIAEITIPDGITSIGDGAFYNCKNITSITIPEGVTRIGKNAFFGCANLRSITFPNSLTSIGLQAFYDCTNLADIAFPNNLASIGQGAFMYCDGLTSITIPSSVTSIEKQAFYACNNLSHVKFEETNGWWYASSATATSGTTISSWMLGESFAHTYLKQTYASYYWKRT